MTSPQMYIMRKVIKSWVEKKLMPRYPELAEGDVKANSDALDELLWPYATHYSKSLVSLLVTLLTRLCFNNLPYATHYSKSLASLGQTFVSKDTTESRAETTKFGRKKNPACQAGSGYYLSASNFLMAEVCWTRSKSNSSNLAKRSRADCRSLKYISTGVDFSTSPRWADSSRLAKARR